MGYKLFLILVEILGQRYLKLVFTHLPLAFHFVSLCLVTPPQATVVLNEISIVLNVRLTVLNNGPRW